MDNQPRKQIEEQDATQQALGNMVLFDLRQLTQFNPERPEIRVLSDIGTARILLFAFKAGQELKEHRTSSQILVQALRGRITFATARNSVKLQAGMFLQLEENVPHSVTAQTDAVMLLTMLPSPAKKGRSQQEEVGHNLEPLVKRE